MYKLVDLQSLAVYCDTNVTMLANLPLQALAVRPCFSLSSLQWLLPLLYSLSVCLPLVSVCFRSLSPSVCWSVYLSVSLCLSVSFSLLLLCICFLFNNKNVLHHTFVQDSFFLPFPSFFPVFSFCSPFFLLLFLSPWYNHAGWLGVKHLFTSLLTLLFLVIMLVICSLFYCCQNGGEGFFIFQYVTFFPLIPSILWVLPVEKFCLLQDELEREMYRTRDNHFKVSYSSSKCIGVGRLDVLQTVQHDVFVNIAVCVCVSSWSYNIPSASV